MRLSNKVALFVVTVGALAGGCGSSERHGGDDCATCSSASAGAGASAGGGVNGGASGSSGSTQRAGNGGVVGVNGGSGGASRGCGSGGTDTLAGAGGSGSGKGGGGGHAGSGVGGAVTGGTGGSGPLDAGAGGEGGAAGPVEPVLIASPAYVTDIYVADGYVYYGDNDAEPGDDETFGHLSRVPVTGGTPTVLAHATPTGVLGKIAEFIPLGILVHDGYVYWTDEKLFDPPSRLAKTPIAGGDTVDAWTDSNCPDILPPLALKGDDLYWLAGCIGAGGTLLTLSTAGGSPRVVASGTSNDWMPAGYGYTDDSDNRALAVANGFAYWTRATGYLIALPLVDGATTSEIARAAVVAGPSALVASGDRLFFTMNDYVQQGQGALLSIVPGDTMNTLAGGQNIEENSALALDETSVYFGVDDAILSVPRDGGDAVTVVASLSNPRSFALDDTSIYWTDDRGGVWRAPKRPR